MNLSAGMYERMIVGLLLCSRKLKGATKLNDRELAVMIWASWFDYFTIYDFIRDAKSEKQNFYLTVKSLQEKGFMQEVKGTKVITYSLTHNGIDMCNKIKKFLQKNNPTNRKYAKAPYNGGLRDKVPATVPAETE